MIGTDYTTVTEAPGDALRGEALDMLATRYAVAAQRAKGRRVLEAGCGAGQGLGLLARTAQFVIGGDYTWALLGYASRQYGGRVPLVRLDAQALPFAADSFDLVVLYEAIYYLHEPEAFLAECRRVLSGGGEVLMCSVNRKVADFNPSPYSVRYFSSEELRAMFQSQGFHVTVTGAFPVATLTLRDRVVSLIKRGAIALQLMPKTMKGKALLKRLFFGPLQAAPAELTSDLGKVETPIQVVAGADDTTYRVLFVHATLHPASTE